MLTQYLLLGLLGAAGGAGTGEVIASDERTVVAIVVQSTASVGTSIPLGAQVWRQHYDPADHTPYAFDFSALLDDGEKIAEIEQISLNATAALLGISVDNTGDYAPIIDIDGEKVQVWFVVNEVQWAATAFNAGGVQVPVTFRVLTDSVPPKRYERTGVLTVRQQ